MNYHILKPGRVFHLDHASLVITEVQFVKRQEPKDIVENMLYNMLNKSRSEKHKKKNVPILDACVIMIPLTPAEETILKLNGSYTSEEYKNIQVPEDVTFRLTDKHGRWFVSRGIRLLARWHDVPSGLNNGTQGFIGMFLEVRQV